MVLINRTRCEAAGVSKGEVNAGSLPVNGGQSHFVFTVTEIKEETEQKSFHY